MLGIIASIVRRHCMCSSCRVVHERALSFYLERLRAPIAPGWDDDLSEVDLEILQKAGWDEASVRLHVQVMQRMLTALTMGDASEAGSGYVCQESPNAQGN